MSTTRETMREIRKYALALFITFSILELISYTAIRIWGSSFSNSLHPNGYYICENNPCKDCKGYVAQPGNTYKMGGAMLIDDYGNMVSKPVTLAKDTHTLRVILEAGSAGWGSGETWQVTEDKTYFQGSYAFESSISGILERELQDSFPGKHVEVINGAVVGHDIQQHFAKYITLDHLFKPDFVVTFAGYNDGMSIALGSCIGSNKWISDYVTQEAIARSSRFPYTVSLINRILAGIGNRGAAKGLENWDGSWFDGEGLEFYKTVEARLGQNSKPIFRVVDAYATQVRKDSSYHIFCLQPLLCRRDVQKKLTPLELKFRTTIDKGKEGVIQPYFFGMYFGPHIDSLMRVNGGSYIDMGKVVEKADEKTEIYLDYCHLTYTGNQLCAHAIAQEVVRKARK